MNRDDIIRMAKARAALTPARASMTAVDTGGSTPAVSVDGLGKRSLAMQLRDW